MDLKFSEMSVDTSLAQEYLKKNAAAIEIYNSDHNGKLFIMNKQESQNDETSTETHQNAELKIVSKLKENATLIAQLEYYNRNIPIEVTSAQLNLFIQYIQCEQETSDIKITLIINPDDPLLVFAREIFASRKGTLVENRSKITAAICHFLITTLLNLEVGPEDDGFGIKQYEPPVFHSFDDPPKTWPVKGLDSGTVAVVSDDADVDSAVDKFIAVPIEAPWRLRRILVQESIYQQFKDALSWKCNLNKSARKSLTSDVLCSETLTHNDKAFLIDPVELTQETQARHIVAVEAYRTTKEMISLVQQYQPRYLSFWTNGIAEINEITHSTISPVVWVNNVADFRGPPQVSKAVFSGDLFHRIKKCEKVAKLCALSQAWIKLDSESRRDILYRFLDQFDQKYTVIKKSLSACTLNSFVDVGKDYVCIGMSQPKGIDGSFYEKSLFSSPETFQSLLNGNALIVFLSEGSEGPDSAFLELLEQLGIPVACLDFVDGDFPVWLPWNPTQTRVVWTNSGTIFAN